MSIRKAELARLNEKRSQMAIDEAHSVRKASSRLPAATPATDSATIFSRSTSQLVAKKAIQWDQVVRDKMQQPSSQGFRAEPGRGITDHEVFIESYGDTTERIRIRAIKEPAKAMTPAQTGQFVTESFSMYDNPPRDPAGRLVDLSDRPISCASYNGTNEVVFGGTDHALYAVDLSDLRKAPIKLYSKRWGHTDWVTSCAYTTSGRILSGAMDSKLCLWSTDKRRCQEIQHHTRSVSAVLAAPGDVAFSASYDSTIALWQVSASERATDGIKPSAVFTGHKSPVLELASLPSLLASGGKDGAVLCWDLDSGQCLMRMRAHDATVTALKLCTHDASLMSGSADGFIKVWDPRRKALLCMRAVHRDRATGQGTPVAGLACVGEHLMVSGGADSAVHVFDRRKLEEPVCSFLSCRTGVYSLAVAGDDRCVFVGDGAGILSCFDVVRERLCYGLGASSFGAVRSVVAAHAVAQVVTGNEDGNALSFRFS